MSKFENSLDFQKRILVKMVYIIERTILRKNIFRLVIKILNRFHLYYFTRLIDPAMMEIIG